MIVSVEKTDTNISKIYPNCIKNRYDLSDVNQYDLLRYTDKNEDITLMVKYVGCSAYLGLYLVSISKKALKRIIKYIFKHNKEIKLIIYEFGYQKLGDNAIEVNHFRIELPETSDLLEARLSKKGRYNIAREKRILQQDFGIWSIHEYPALSTEAEAVWEKYFAYKSITHGERWKNCNRDEYCKEYGVSTVYALVLGEDEQIASIILSCEDCPEVYIDNLTYDASLQKYSLGQILYDEYLKILIGKKRKELFLRGGNYSYKKRYGSKEEKLYNCKIERNPRLIKAKIMVWNTLVKLKLIKE